jgi:hypothetical protein
MHLQSYQKEKLHLGNQDHSSETAEPIGEGHGHVLMPEHRTQDGARRLLPWIEAFIFFLIFLFQGHGMVVCPCTAPRKRLGFPWRVRFGFGHCRSPFRRCRTDMRFPVIEPRRQQRAMDAACVSCVEKETNPSGILVSSSLPANRRTAPYIYIYVTRCDQPLSSF